MTTRPVPDHLHTVGVHLGLQGCAEAIEFYKKAFGATEVLARITDGSGRVGHAELKIGDSVIYLADEHPEIGLVGPKTLGGSPVMFTLNVDNVDELFARAVAAGATAKRPVSNQFYGDRTGIVEDPFGYQWMISTHVEDVSEEEMLARYAKGQGG